jgi:3-oxoacyl-(acyl-carrier-protein) synthase
MITGGIDKNVDNFSHFILDSVGALNTVENDKPKTAVRPFDKTRKGACQADGGAMLIMESLESAKSRGAKILAEVVGYHSCSIADNIYKPNKLGIQKVMAGVMKQAGWAPKDVDHINGHATATLIGDPVEADAIKCVLGTKQDKLYREEFAEEGDLDLTHIKNASVSGYKGHLGHLNLASGATESALCIMGMLNDVAPGTANLADPVDPDLNFVLYKKNHHKKINRFMKVAVGFGANNAALGFQRFVE